MAQFEVFAHPVKALRAAQPYVVQVQNPLWAGLATVVVIPLVRLKHAAREGTVLNPVLECEGERYLLSTPEIFSIHHKYLGPALADLGSHRRDILAALDRLFSGI